MNEEECGKYYRKLPRKTYTEPLYPFAPLPPNTLTNADGTPYRAGYDDDLREAKLRELVFQALGEASMCWEKIPQGKFDDVRAKAIGEKLIQQIKEMQSQ